MKTLLFVLVLMAVSATMVWAESEDSVHEISSALSSQQIATADSLIWHLFRSPNQPKPISYDPLVMGCQVFLETKEISADNAGWLWSMETDDLMRAGIISSEYLVYHEVVVNAGLISDLVGRYQQVLLYEQGKFYLTEQVWFYEQVYWGRILLGYIIALFSGMAILWVSRKIMRRA
ncbi:MAG: hypothetical protein WCS88_01005 [Patescibacteria group bacterium]